MHIMRKVILESLFDLDLTANTLSMGINPDCVKSEVKKAGTYVLWMDEV